MWRELVISSVVGMAASGAGMMAAAESQPSARPYTRNVAIVLYEGVELLDFAGPGEVFQAAASFSEHGDQGGFKVYTVATTTKPILSQHFLHVVPDFSIDDAPKPDVLVIPGGQSGALLGDPKFMAWAAKVTKEAEITLTVCTGAFVPGKLGLLDGKTATTWYGAIERLRRDVPKATVQEGRRFVDNGSIITTAGVSAGIDGALHAVARLTGRAVADQTARYMEYHWTPEPYLATTYTYLNPSLDEAGRTAQRAELLAEEKK
ncbi:MAG: DJ-1/PfpI family protein [Candidatus Polarisedimenticolia bacterium]